MMNLEEAKKIAKDTCEELNLEVDDCIEYPDAFVFSNTKSEEIGGLLPFVVMKKTKKVVKFNFYLDNTLADMDDYIEHTI